MTQATLLIEPYDPVIFRDGRPFTDGLPASTLPFPMPSSTIGAIRSRSHPDLDFEDDEVVKKILSIEQTGPFPAVWNEAAAKWELAFPAPADAVPYRSGPESIEFEPLRPQEPIAGGCNLPDGMRPLFLSNPRKGKADEGAPRFWRAGFMLDWLKRKQATALSACPNSFGFAGLPLQRRVHVAIDPTTLLARDGMLFTTDGLEFTLPVSEGAVKKIGRLRAERAAIVTRVSLEFKAQWPRVAPIGGERRLAFWSELNGSAVDWPQSPASSGDLIRVILATPGIFAEGWKPAWCTHGKPPGTSNLELKLIAAAVPRFQPVSGWDLRKGQCGPKPTRFLAPAGSVYFFRCKGDPDQLWMRSISDAPEDQRDGFGIALIGDC